MTTPTSDPSFFTIVTYAIGYFTLVAVTYFIITWITPIDKQPKGDEAEGLGVGLTFFYPVVAPIALMGALKLRLHKRRLRKFKQREREEEVIELEHKARLKELQAAQDEVDRYVERRD